MREVFLTLRATQRGQHHPPESECRYPHNNQRHRNMNRLLITTSKTAASSLRISRVDRSTNHLSSRFFSSVASGGDGDVEVKVGTVTRFYMAEGFGFMWVLHVVAYEAPFPGRLSRLPVAIRYAVASSLIYASWAWVDYWSNFVLYNTQIGQTAYMMV